MTRKIKQIWHKILVFLHLSPLSLAEKCRIAFGTAVVLVLMLALSIPHVWMGQLTKNAALDAGRARSEMLLRQHFRIKQADQQALAELDDSGAVVEPNDSTIRWIRFKTVGGAQKGSFADLTEDDEGQLQQLPDRQKQMIESLRIDDRRDDNVFFARENGMLTSNYVRIFRAGDSCISCHNPQGSAIVFGRNQAIGAAVIRRPADKIGKTLLMNWLWITVAGLIVLVGAIVAFYMITQRVILRPIRQLRALANNVADGNLDVRSSIKTRDEYEKLADDRLGEQSDKVQARVKAARSLQEKRFRGTKLTCNAEMTPTEVREFCQAEEAAQLTPALPTLPQQGVNLDYNLSRNRWESERVRGLKEVEKMNYRAILSME